MAKSPLSFDLGSILVFGGCGFLGQHIVKHLSECPDVSEITIFDIVAAPATPIHGIKYVTGNISSREQVDAVFNRSKPRVVFHTVSPGPFSKNLKLFEDVNVKGTENVLNAHKPPNLPKRSYTPQALQVTEDALVIFWPQQPEFYSHTKAIAESMVLSANRDNIRTSAIRPAGLFGEGDNRSVTSVIMNAREGKGKLQIGDNSNLFDWTYVGNNAYAQILTTRALLGSYANPPVQNDLKVDGEAFVITNDDPWPFWDFTRAIAAAAGYPLRKEEVMVLPWRVMMVFAWISEWAYWIFTLGRKEPRLNQARIKYTTMTRTFDISKAKKRLGYEPQVGTQEGIERAANWFLDEYPEGRK